MAPDKNLIREALAKFSLSDKAFKAVFEEIEFAYSEGCQDTEQELAVNEEKIGVEYAKEEFAGIDTMYGFVSKYQEITNRSLNFMQPVGLK